MEEVRKTDLAEQEQEHAEEEEARSSLQDAHLSVQDGEDHRSDVTLSPKELGRRGEQAAAKFLKRRGFEVLHRNWTCFAGEVDIVALQEDTLCFVEVKTRSNIKKGFPSEAVDDRKRERYERIAACYLKEHAYEDLRVRFDVISILALSNDRAFLRHHINAFGSM